MSTQRPGRRRRRIAPIAAVFVLVCASPWLESQSLPSASEGPTIDLPVRDGYVLGHVVAQFSPSVSDAVIRQLAAEVSATDVRTLPFADFHYILIPSASDPADVAQRLGSRPGVVWAEPDPFVYTLHRPNDEFYDFQWHLQRLGMEETWDINLGGSNDVVVAVLDSGIAYTNVRLRYPGGVVYEFAQAPDLQGTRFVPGFDFIWGSERPVDTSGHGTHVSGTVAQTTDNQTGMAGMAFNVSLMPVKVVRTQFDVFAGASLPFGASTVALGIRFAVENGAKVINMSIGGQRPMPLVRDALEFAVDSGVFVAISAGNSGTDPQCPNCPDWPAAYADEFEGVMAVAALDFNFNRAPYSTVADYVEIAAPGGDVSRDDNQDSLPDGVLQETLVLANLQRVVTAQFGPNTLPAAILDPQIFTFFQPDIFFQGTSMASPHVAGFAALLYDQGVTSPAAIEAAIKRFAVDLGPIGPDAFTGHGVLNPRETLRGLGLVR